MMRVRVIATRPQFRSVTEAEVKAALETSNFDPISREVTRLAHRYLHNLRARTKNGRVPERFPDVEPQTAVEAAGLRMLMEIIERELSEFMRIRSARSQGPPT